MGQCEINTIDTTLHNDTTLQFGPDDAVIIAAPVYGCLLYTSFEFNKVVSGVQEQRPRWKRALGATEGAMGEAVGQLYVERYFPESSKQYMICLL